MSPGSYKFDEFELDGARFELRRNGKAVKLERIPLELLILLVEKNGNVVTRTEIGYIANPGKARMHCAPAC